MLVCVCGIGHWSYMNCEQHQYQIVGDHLGHHRDVDVELPVAHLLEGLLHAGEDPCSVRPPFLRLWLVQPVAGSREQRVATDCSVCVCVCVCVLISYAPITPVAADCSDLRTVLQPSAVISEPVATACNDL